MWLDDLVRHNQELLGEESQEALWLRGVSDEQISMYRIGYMGKNLPEGPEYPEQFRKWWAGHRNEIVDSFVFPLTNWLGETRGIQLRPVDRSCKQYMDYFLDRMEPVFFGLGEAAQAVWDLEEVVLVEGNFDLLPIQRSVPNVISTLTAKVSDQLARSLHRFVKKVHLFYDNDKAGRRGIDNFVKFHGAKLDINPWRYPTGVVLSNGKPVKDPGDLWEAWGDRRLAAYTKSQLE